MNDQSDSPPEDGRGAAESEYRRALERSMSSIEDHIADVAASLEKLRKTQHDLVAKTIVLDDIANQLAVISTLAKTQADLVKAVGRMGDRLEEVATKWETESSDIRRRLGTLETDGKRV